jgi:hypothetical protein
MRSRAPEASNGILSNLTSSRRVTYLIDHQRVAPWIVALVDRPRHYRPRRGAAIVSGTIVGIALLIRRPAAITAVWG